MVFLPVKPIHAKTAVKWIHHVPPLSVCCYVSNYVHLNLKLQCCLKASFSLLIILLDVCSCHVSCVMCDARVTCLSLSVTSLLCSQGYAPAPGTPHSAPSPGSMGSSQDDQMPPGSPHGGWGHGRPPPASPSHTPGPVSSITLVVSTLHCGNSRLT